MEAYKLYFVFIQRKKSPMSVDIKLISENLVIREFGLRK